MSRCGLETNISGKDRRAVIEQALPEGVYGHIVLKPNWVKHEDDPAFPISALVTDPRLIEDVIEACRARYRGSLRKISVGDVPLQTCQWERLVEQAGIDRLIAKYSDPALDVEVRFLDLRRERFVGQSGFWVLSNADPGDPSGYREVLLDSESLLDPICTENSRFRVADYAADETSSSHRPGQHRYLVSATILEADLIINLPKMKTHQKAGITGALKNLVGINGQKAYLAHYRAGQPAQGGDEFPPGAHPAVMIQSKLREKLQKRSRVAFGVARWGWRLVKAALGIQTRGTRENLGKNFYVAGGAWPGNDTIWRMVYDLNAIILRSPSQGGVLAATRQRDYFCILDAGVSGEGNGPLQPLPVPTDALIMGDNPFVVDMVMAAAMGFDYQRIPSTRHFREFKDPEWSGFDPETVRLTVNGERRAGLGSVPRLHSFQPPPGWEEIVQTLPSTKATAC